MIDKKQCYTFGKDTYITKEAMDEAVRNFNLNSQNKIEIKGDKVITKISGFECILFMKPSK